jgi:LL-diaminopimelate aminotransferase
VEELKLKALNVFWNLFEFSSATKAIWPVTPWLAGNRCAALLHAGGPAPAHPSLCRIADPAEYRRIFVYGLMNAKATFLPTSALRRLPPYIFAELDRLKNDARARGVSLVDLGMGSPDLPISPAIIQALTEAARDGATHGYPLFRGALRYLDSIGRFMRSRFGVVIDPLRQALALSGAKEGLAQIVMALCGPGDLALIPEIYYPVYARSVWLAGADVRWVPMRANDGFVVDLNAISEQDARAARVLIVNYPNNPTGARVERELYDRAVAFAHRHNVLLISDLAYSELSCGSTPAPSALEADPDCKTTIEFHSCSKTFNMAGLRIGFAVGNTDAIEALAAYRTNVGYGTPTALQHAASYALDHRTELVPPTVREYQYRRDTMIASFARAGWRISAPTASMYLWLPVPEGLDDWIWVETLVNEDGLVVTPGVAFGEGGRGFFRISLVRDAETLGRAAEIITMRRDRLSHSQGACKAGKSHRRDDVALQRWP